MMKQSLILMIIWTGTVTWRRTKNPLRKTQSQSKKETTKQESQKHSTTGKRNTQSNARRTCQLAIKSNLIIHNTCLNSSKLAMTTWEEMSPNACSTATTSPRSRLNSETHQEHSFLNGSSMFTESSDWPQSAYMSPNTSLISTWVDRKSQKASSISLEFQSSLSLQNMRRSIHQSSETSWLWARTNSPGIKCSPRKKKSWTSLNSRLQLHQHIDSWRATEESLQFSKTKRFSSSLSSSSRCLSSTSPWWDSSHQSSQLQLWSSHASSWRKLTVGVKTWRNSPDIKRVIWQMQSLKSDNSLWRSIPNSSLLWNTSSRNQSIWKWAVMSSSSERWVRASPLVEKHVSIQML